MKTYKSIVLILFFLLSIASVNAQRIVLVNPGNNFEGSRLTLIGKGISNKTNPAKIILANEDGEDYGELPVLRSSAKKIISTLPYVSATRMLILKVSGGKISEETPELIPVIVYNNPSLLDEEDGDAEQAPTDAVNGSVLFEGVEGEVGDKGLPGEDGADGTRTSVDPSSRNNTFTANYVLGDSNSDTLTFISTIQGSSAINLEGASTNSSETNISIADPSADRTITLPDADGTIVHLGNNAQSFENGLTIGDTSSDALTINASIQDEYALYLDGSTNDNNRTNFVINDPSADRNLTFPDASGNIEMRGLSSQTLIISGQNIDLSLENDNFGYTILSPSSSNTTLTSISNALGAGQIVNIHGVNITVTDSEDTSTTGEIDLAGNSENFVLDSGEMIFLMYTGNVWVEIGHIGDPANN